MREYGIPMSWPMVLATLRDQKTMTRRVVKMPDGVYDESHDDSCRVERIRGSSEFALRLPDGRVILSPYGKAGDRLWVREAHFYTSGGDVIYRADYPQNAIARGLENVPPTLEAVKAAGYRWRPSFFLPRRDARILAENMGVRVERLQDITAEDVAREGVVVGPERTSDATRITRFATLWDSLNEQRGFPWESNPWVWVIRYRRLTTAEVAA